MRVPLLPSVVGTAIVFYHLLIAQRVAQRERDVARQLATREIAE